MLLGSDKRECGDVRQESVNKCSSILDDVVEMVWLSISRSSNFLRNVSLLLIDAFPTPCHFIAIQLTLMWKRQFAIVQGLA